MFGTWHPRWCSSPDSVCKGLCDFVDLVYKGGNPPPPCRLTVEVAKEKNSLKRAKMVFLDQKGLIPDLLSIKMQIKVVPPLPPFREYFWDMGERNDP